MHDSQEQKSNNSEVDGTFSLKAFLSRDGTLLSDRETLLIGYRLRQDHEDGVEFVRATNEAGEMRHLDDYHLPTILHAYRRHLHDSASGEP